MKARWIVLLAFASALAALALGVVLYLGVVAHTPPLTDADGKQMPGSIAVLEKLELGGLEQWILIRGADRSRPVLVWLHGGPGGAQMAFAHHVDRQLEQHFVVVHWDQRGAGKSNHRGFDERTMRFEQYVHDARELVEHVRRRLGREKVVLLGHSWGTRLGIELVQAYPQYFYAYVGVSQVVNHERATEMARDWLLATIDPAEAPGDLRSLLEIEVPVRRHSEYRKLNTLTNTYGGSLDLGSARLACILARAPEYTVVDYGRLLSGMTRGGGPMHEGGLMASYNLVETVPAVAVPVYFFMGANDYNTPLALVREYYDAIDAPDKRLVVFEESAHLPFLAEPEKFDREMIRIADTVAGEGS